jgi:hypothetical protein
MKKSWVPRAFYLFAINLLSRSDLIRHPKAKLSPGAVFIIALINRPLD